MLKPYIKCRNPNGVNNYALGNYGKHLTGTTCICNFWYNNICLFIKYTSSANKTMIKWKLKYSFRYQIAAWAFPILDKLFLRPNILPEIYSWLLTRNFITILTHGSIPETDEPQQILALASWNNLLSRPALSNQPALICPDLLVAYMVVFLIPNVRANRTFINYHIEG